MCVLPCTQSSHKFIIRNTWRSHGILKYEKVYETDRAEKKWKNKIKRKSEI